jgi:hypothetical protein
MMLWIAVGGSLAPGSANDWDLRPLIAVAVALYALHKLFGVRLTPVVAFFAFLIAPMFLPMAEAIGYDAAAMVVIVVIVIAAIAFRRTRSHP